MFKKTTLLYCLLLLVKTGFSQLYTNNFNTYYVCENGEVYASGNNTTRVPSSIFGTLGTGSLSANVLTPEKVLGGPNVDIQKIVSGNANQFMLTCSGEVYAWGNNTQNQLGTATNQNVNITTAEKVLTGEQNSQSGFLSGIIDIDSDDEFALALTADRKALIWGAGMSPTFLTDTSGQVLENIISIAFEDSGILLLIEDINGVGTVYSYAPSFITPVDPRDFLGRNGSGNDILPVEHIDGLPLAGITSIVAGDVMGFAVDTSNRLWSWGTGGWGGLTGSSFFPQNHNYALPVIDSSSNQIEVMQVFAGRGNAHAILMDGSVVGWGNNDVTAGMLGFQNTGGHYHVADTLFYQDGSLFQDIVYGVQNDQNTFLFDSNNDIWVFGSNEYGELGTGDLQSITVPTKINLPASCVLPAPKPNLYLGEDQEVCNSHIEEVKPVFPISNYYILEWEEDGRPFGIADFLVTTADFVSASIINATDNCGNSVSVSDEIIFTNKDVQVDFFYQESCEPILHLGLTSDEYVQAYLLDGGDTIPWLYADEAKGYSMTFGNNFQSHYSVGVTNSPGPNAIFSAGYEPICGSPQAFAPDINFVRVVVYEDVVLDSIEVLAYEDVNGGVQDWVIEIYNEEIRNDAFIADRNDLYFRGDTIKASYGNGGFSSYYKQKLAVGALLKGSESGKGYWIGCSEGRMAASGCDFPTTISNIDLGSVRLDGLAYLGNPINVNTKGYQTGFTFTKTYEPCPVRHIDIVTEDPNGYDCNPFDTVITDKGLVFDGVDDRVDIPKTNENQVFDGDFTLEAIIRAGSSQVIYPQIMANRSGISTGLLMGLWSDGRLYFRSNSGNYFYNKGTGRDLRDGECHHVALTKENGLVSIYVDGIFEASQQINHQLNTSNSLVIGNDHYQAIPFNGGIKEVRIWNVARTSQQIAENSNKKLSGTESGLVAYYPMDEAQDQQVVDYSSNSHDIYLGTDDTIENSDPTRGDACGMLILHDLEVKDETLIKVYPNPTNGFVQVSGPNLKYFEVFDISSQKVLFSNTESIDMTELSEGIYFVKVVTELGKEELIKVFKH